MNSYEILEVDQNTDLEIIKKKYQKLILKVIIKILNINF